MQRLYIGILIMVLVLSELYCGINLIFVKNLLFKPKSASP